MSVPISTAPALLVGLGARILLDIFNRTEEPTLRDTVLLGVWQGVALQYAGKNTYAAIAVGLGIAIKLLLDFTTSPVTTKCIASVIGVVLGVVGTDLLSSYVDQFFSVPERKKRPPPPPPHHYHNKSSHSYDFKPQRERLVQFRPSVQGGSIDSEVPYPRTISDITSVDSNSDLINPKSSMTPLEREIAALRARASLADSERRRYREERKWAESQGNQARAEQMKWEYKRHKALMQNCHREADAKLLEASKAKQTRREYGVDTFGPSSSAPRERITRDNQTSGHSSPSYADYRAARQRRISVTK